MKAFSETVEYKGLSAPRVNTAAAHLQLLDRTATLAERTEAIGKLTNQPSTYTATVLAQELLRTSEFATSHP